MADNEKNNKPEEVREEPQILTPVQRFKKMFDCLGDLFVLNIFFTVSCLPIFTIGVAFTALYTVTNKMIRNEEGPIAKEYIKALYGHPAYLTNKQSTSCEMLSWMKHKL